MQKKHFKFTPVLIFSLSFLVTVSLAGLICLLYFMGVIAWPRGTLPNCVRLHAGTTVVEVRYSDQFIDMSHSDVIRINRRDPLDASKSAVGQYVLGIAPLYYETVEDIIANALVEPGPKYQKSNFNGYDAGFYSYIDEENRTWDNYEIPFGNRNFYLFYHPFVLSDDQEKIGEKMLKSITFTEVAEDIKNPRVENCGK